MAAPNDYLQGLGGSYLGEASKELNANVTTSIKRFDALKWTRKGDFEWAVITEITDHTPPAKRQRGGVNYATGKFFPIVRNRGAEDVNFYHFVPHLMMEAHVVAPSGKQHEIVLGRAKPEAKPSAYAFKTLKPGEFALIGYGSSFPPFTELGIYNLIIRYENEKEDGATFDKANVFQGKVEFGAEVAVLEED